MRKLLLLLSALVVTGCVQHARLSGGGPDLFSVDYTHWYGIEQAEEVATKYCATRGQQAHYWSDEFVAVDRSRARFQCVNATRQSIAPIVPFVPILPTLPTRLPDRTGPPPF